LRFVERGRGEFEGGEGHERSSSMAAEVEGGMGKRGGLDESELKGAAFKRFLEAKDDREDRTATATLEKKPSAPTKGDFGRKLSAFQEKDTEEQKGRMLSRPRDKSGKFMGSSQVETVGSEGKPMFSSSSSRTDRKPLFGARKSATKEMPTGPEGYFIVPPPQPEEIVSYERAASFSAVGDNFELPREEVILEDTRLTAKRPKVKILDHFIEADLHGRGFKGAHPGVADPEDMVRRFAQARLDEIARLQMDTLPGDYVSYDVYGRADPRIFSEGADTASKEQAFEKMMKLRTAAISQKRDVHIAPAHPRLLGNPVVTRAESERVQSVIAEILKRKDALKEQDVDERRRAREIEMERLEAEEREKAVEARARAIKSTDEFKSYFNIVDDAENKDQRGFAEDHSKFLVDKLARFEQSQDRQEPIAKESATIPVTEVSTSASSIAARFEQIDRESSVSQAPKSSTMPAPSKLINKFEPETAETSATVEEKAPVAEKSEGGGVSNLLARFQKQDDEDAAAKKLPSDTTVQVPKTDAPAPDQAATTSDIVAEAPPAAEVPQTAEAPSAVEEAVKPVNKVPKKPTTGTEALGEVKKPVKKVTKKQPVRPQAPEDTASKDVVAGVTPVGVTTSSEAPVAAAPKKKTKKKLPASAAPESTEPAAAVVAMEEPKAKMTGVVGEASGAVAAPKKAVKKVVKKKPAAPEPEPMAA